ncbi:MAG: site-specific DNA-methyltransferase [Bradymonadales bacterium]|jgi:site-specific DNA-methyltransferase (adenine-specific)
MNAQTQTVYNAELREQLIWADCVEIFPQIADESVHALISDIPYGIAYDEWDVLHDNQNTALGGSCEAQKKRGALFKRRGKPLNGWSEADRQIPAEYQRWCGTWAGDALRVLKPGGSCIIFAGRRYAHRCIVALEDAGFSFKDSLAWIKDRAPLRAQRLSVVFKRRGDIENAQRWPQHRLANLMPLYEPILWFQKPYKTGRTLTNNMLEHEVGAWNEEALKKYNIFKTHACSNIIQVEVSVHDRGMHPAQKPLNLMKLLVELVTQPKQIVLDPFMGCGSTCLASAMLQRHYIGIEQHVQHYQNAKKRLEML